MDEHSPPERGPLWGALPVLAFVWANFCRAKALNVDDAVLTMMAQGVGIADAPTPFLYYSNYLVGAALSALYGALPDVPWYWGWLLALRLVTDFAISWALLRRGRSWLVRVGVVAYFALFSIPAYATVSYTMTAMIAPAGAVVLLLSDLRAGELPRRSTVLVAACLAIGAALTRLEAAFVFGGLLLPLTLAPMLPVMRRHLRIGRRAAATAAIRGIIAFFFVPALLTAVSQAQFTRAGWREFQDFNAQKQALIDYRRLPDAADLETRLASVGWGEHDLAAMQKWILFDRDLYNGDTLAALIEPASLPSPRRLKELTANIWGTRGTRLLLGIGALGITYLALSVSPLVAALGVGFLVAVLATLIIFFQRITGFVFLPLCAGWALLALPLLKDRQDHLVGAVLAATLVLFAPANFRALEAMDNRIAALTATSTALLQSLPRSRHYIFQDQVPLFGLDPAQNLRPLTGLKIFLLGTPSQTPATAARLRRLGFADYYQLLLANDTVVIANAEGRDVLAKLLDRRKRVTVGFEAVPSQAFEVSRIVAR